MKRILFGLVAVGILGVFVGLTQAHDYYAYPTRVVEVHRSYYTPSYEYYRPSRHGYRAYAPPPPPPGYTYPVDVQPYPVHGPRDYFYYPRSGVYYSSPGLSIGVGF